MGQARDSGLQSRKRDVYTYGYDRAGNRNYRENLSTGSAKDELYAYDGLYRLSSFDRGNLNAAKTAMTGTPANEEDFSLDPTGNWKTFAQTAASATTLQTRTHNDANEITGIAETVGTSWPIRSTTALETGSVQNDPLFWFHRAPFAMNDDSDNFDGNPYGAPISESDSAEHRGCLSHGVRRGIFVAVALNVSSIATMMTLLSVEPGATVMPITQAMVVILLAIVGLLIGAPLCLSSFPIPRPDS